MSETIKPLTHPYHIALEAAGHKLIRDEDGDVDIFRLDANFHNGPECELCGETWCHHCKEDIEPCNKTTHENQ